MFKIRTKQTYTKTKRVCVCVRVYV